MKDAKGHGSISRGVSALGHKAAEYMKDETGGGDARLANVGMKFVEEIAREHGIDIGHLLAHIT
jgi:hypothetical protein